MQNEDRHEFDTLRDLKSTLMQIKGVQAVGETEIDGVPCLKIYFIDQASLDSAKLPEKHMVPIIKSVVGEIALQ